MASLYVNRDLVPRPLMERAVDHFDDMLLRLPSVPRDAVDSPIGPPLNSSLLDYCVREGERLPWGVHSRGEFPLCLSASKRETLRRAMEEGLSLRQCNSGVLSLFAEDCPNRDYVRLALIRESQCNISVPVTTEGEGKDSNSNSPYRGSNNKRVVVSSDGWDWSGIRDTNTSSNNTNISTNIGINTNIHNTNTNVRDTSSNTNTMNTTSNNIHGYRDTLLGPSINNNTNISNIGTNTIPNTNISSNIGINTNIHTTIHGYRDTLLGPSISSNSNRISRIVGKVKLNDVTSNNIHRYRHTLLGSYISNNTNIIGINNITSSNSDSNVTSNTNNNNIISTNSTNIPNSNTNNNNIISTNTIVAEIEIDLSDTVLGEDSDYRESFLRDWAEMKSMMSRNERLTEIVDLTDDDPNPPNRDTITTSSNTSASDEHTYTITAEGGPIDLPPLHTRLECLFPPKAIRFRPGGAMDVSGPPQPTPKQLKAIEEKERREEEFRELMRQANERRHQKQLEKEREIQEAMLEWEENKRLRKEQRDAARRSKLERNLEERAVRKMERDAMKKAEKEAIDAELFAKKAARSMGSKK